MADPEHFDILEAAAQAAEEAERVLEEREYPVSLRVNTAAALDEYLLTSKGLYFFPEEGDSFWEDPEYARVLTVVSRIRAGLEIESRFNYPLKSDDPEARTTVHLRTTDMDVVNGLIAGDIDLNKIYPAEWWIQGDQRVHSDEAYETRLNELRLGGLLADARSLAMLRELNTAFMSAGAPPRPDYTRFFEVPSQG